LAIDANIFWPLRAVDVAVAPRERLHRDGGVGTAARLGQCHHADRRAGQQVGKVCLDLLGGAAEIDAAGARRALLVVARREPNVVPCHLFLDHRRGEVAEIRAAHGLGEHGAVETRCTGLPDQVSRELATLLVRVHDGHDFLLHEAVDHVAYCFDLVGVHRIHRIFPPRERDADRLSSEAYPAMQAPSTVNTAPLT
jgi:hypothetical protein